MQLRSLISKNLLLFLVRFLSSALLYSHDTQRGSAALTYKNGTLYTLVNVFMLSFPYGEVRVMSSYYFSDTDQGLPQSA